MLVMAVKNKEAKTVAKAIFNEWFCKFGIPAQIHTDGGKEFVNKLSSKLFNLLTFNILKQLRPIPSAMPRLKFSTKESRST